MTEAGKANPNDPALEGEKGGAPAEPQDETRELVEIASSLQPYLERNRQIIEQITQQAGLHRLALDEMTRMLAASVDVSRVLAQQIRYLNLRQAFQSPALDLAKSTNQSIAAILEKLVMPDVSEVFRRAIDAADVQRAQREMLDRAFASLPHHDLQLTAYLADVAKYSVLSQTALSRLPGGEMGSALSLQAQIQGALQGVFVDFTQSYSRLFASFQATPSLLAALPLSVSRLPPIELFVGVAVAEAITVVPAEDVELLEENRQALAVTGADAADQLEVLLGRLNRDQIGRAHV